MYLGKIVELADGRRAVQHADASRTRQALLSAVPIPDPKIEKRRKRIILEGRRAQPDEPALGLPLPHPLPDRDREVQGRGAAVYGLRQWALRGLLARARVDRPAAGRRRHSCRAARHRSADGVARLSRLLAIDEEKDERSRGLRLSSFLAFVFSRRVLQSIWAYKTRVCLAAFRLTLRFSGVWGGKSRLEIL